MRVRLGGWPVFAALIAATISPELLVTDFTMVVLRLILQKLEDGC